MSKILKSVAIGEEKLEEIKTLLLSNDRVKIAGIGTLKVRQIKQVTKFSHFTGKEVTIPATKRVVLVPLESLKEFINK